MSDQLLIDQSFDIAWSVLVRSGDLVDADKSAQFLFNQIVRMMEKGERRRLLLSNTAIDRYRQRFCKLVVVKG
jgi:hypothetical protein